MTSQKTQIQNLIAEIDAILGQANPRLPWVISGKISQQRQLLEKTRSYLVSIEQIMTTPVDFGAAGLGNTETASETSAQQVLQAVLQEMTYLRTQLVQPMRTEVTFLQQQREQLLQEVKALEIEQLQQNALPPQPATDLMQELMERLQATLSDQIRQTLTQASAEAHSPYLLQGQEIKVDSSSMQRLKQIESLQAQSDQLLLKLDTTLRIVFESLHSSIESYQDSLSQGLDKMHNLGQQGEVIFTALISHLAKQLSQDTSDYIESNRLAQEERAQLSAGAANPTASTTTVPDTSDTTSRGSESTVDSLNLDDLELSSDLDGEDITLLQLDEEMTQFQLDEDSGEATVFQIDDESIHASPEQTSIKATQDAALLSLLSQDHSDPDAPVDAGQTQQNENIDALYESLFGASEIPPEAGAVPEPRPSSAPDMSSADQGTSAPRSPEHSESLASAAASVDLPSALDALSDVDLTQESEAETANLSADLTMTGADDIPEPGPGPEPNELDLNLESLASLDNLLFDANPDSDSPELQPAPEDELQNVDDSDAIDSSTFFGEEGGALPIEQPVSPPSETISTLTDLLPKNADGRSSDALLATPELLDALETELAIDAGEQSWTQENFIPAAPDEKLLSDDATTDEHPPIDFNLALDESVLQTLDEDLLSLENLPPSDSEFNISNGEQTNADEQQESAVFLEDHPIADGSIEDSPIADGSIADGPIADSPMADGPIADGSIADSPIADGPRAGGSIAGGSIEDSPIADGPIADGSMEDGSIEDSLGATEKPEASQAERLDRQGLATEDSFPEDKAEQELPSEVQLDPNPTAERPNAALDDDLSNLVSDLALSDLTIPEAQPEEAQPEEVQPFDNAQPFENDAQPLEDAENLIIPEQIHGLEDGWDLENSLPEVQGDIQVSEVLSSEALAPEPLDTDALGVSSTETTWTLSELEQSTIEPDRPEAMAESSDALDHLLENLLHEELPPEEEIPAGSEVQPNAGELLAGLPELNLVDLGSPEDDVPTGLAEPESGLDFEPVFEDVPLPSEPITDFKSFADITNDHAASDGAPRDEAASDTAASEDPLGLDLSDLVLPDLHELDQLQPDLASLDLDGLDQIQADFNLLDLDIDLPDPLSTLPIDDPVANTVDPGDLSEEIGLDLTETELSVSETNSDVINHFETIDQPVDAAFILDPPDPVHADLGVNDLGANDLGANDLGANAAVETPTSDSASQLLDSPPLSPPEGDSHLSEEGSLPMLETEPRATQEMEIAASAAASQSLDPQSLDSSMGVPVDSSPQQTDVPEHNWFLGIDFGTTGLSAVLLDRLTDEVYPIYWQNLTPEAGGPERIFRLPAIVDLAPASPEAPSRWQIQASGLAAIQTAWQRNVQANAALTDGLLLRQLKPLLKVGIPHHPRASDDWQPTIKWSADQQLPLQLVQAGLSDLLQSLQGAATAAALGLTEISLQTVLQRLKGIIIGYPPNWPDTYCFNLREAILATGLIDQADQVFFIEEAIATVLSGLPKPTPAEVETTGDGTRQQTLYNSDWQGGTAVICAGATLTELALVDLPNQLTTLTYQDFALKTLNYAGDAIDQDIICQLLLPHKNRQTRHPRGNQPNPVNRYASGGWNWQPNLAAITPEDWDKLSLDDLPCPRAGEPDLILRHELQQHLEGSLLGQSLLEAARYLKLILQHQGQFQLELGHQRWNIRRRDLESRIFLPYIQRVNRHINMLLSQTGLSAQGINQVICTGGSASLAAFARWLRQKFPNATIVQDTYPSDRPASCSRVAYGLANLARYPQVLDVNRHQYSDYFLLWELLRHFPHTPLPIGGILHRLEQHGLNIQACQMHLMALLEGHLPPGIVPTEADRTLLQNAPAELAAYRQLVAQSLFTKQGGQTYVPNPSQAERLTQYLAMLLQGKQQQLAEPLVADLAMNMAEI